MSLRVKQLKTTRWILIAIGFLTIVVNGIQLEALPSQVQQEIERQLWRVRHHPDYERLVSQAVDDAVRVGNWILGSTIVLGIIFVGLGFMAQAYPVPIMWLGLILYSANALIYMALDPRSLRPADLVAKVIVVIVLAIGIHLAILFQRQRDTQTRKQVFHAGEQDWLRE